jgi:hypothetical protein
MTYVCATTPSLNVKDRLARIEGVGEVQLFGAATIRCASGSTRRRSPSTA